MAADSLAVFFSASLLLALAPGPDNLFVLSLSLNHGRRAGLLVVAGLCSGLLVHTGIVATGLAATLATFPSAMKLITTIGAVYLVYLAWLYWRSASTHAAPPPAPTTGAKLYLRGFIMNVSNPKVGLFFLAFLPQFVDPAGPQPALQVVMLGMLFILSTVVIFGGIALLAGRYNQRIAENPLHQRWMNRVTSLVLLLLALNLLRSWL
jgi:threonine/homoserine/homoserine lactone efflux protein